jgi:hypothetical protein
MLDLPHHVEAQPIGQLHLVEGLLDEPLLGVLLPGTGELVLVEDAELHAPNCKLTGIHFQRATASRGVR